MFGSEGVCRLPENKSVAGAVALWCKSDASQENGATERYTKPALSSGQTARIALFVPTLGGGGAERVMVTLANALAERG